VSLGEGSRIRAVVARAASPVRGFADGVRRHARPWAWRLAAPIMADRAHRHQLRLHAASGQLDSAKRFVEVHGPEVRRGPFRGMRYEVDRVVAVQKLIGAYERELHDWLERALARRPDRFVDIGAADGYYAIGIARRGVRVEAFEMSRFARRQLGELAKLNGVTIHMHGTATAARLRRLPLDRTLVLSDCEGAEVDIFDAETVAALRTATVLIEVHESLRPGAEATLRRRFSKTHACQRTAPGVHDQRDYPELAAAGPLDWQRAIDEIRSGETPWLLFTPREATP
jgi:hypothetical protein